MHTYFKRYRTYSKRKTLMKNNKQSFLFAYEIVNKMGPKIVKCILSFFTHLTWSNAYVIKTK